LPTLFITVLKQYPILVRRAGRVEGCICAFAENSPKESFQTNDVRGAVLAVLRGAYVHLQSTLPRKPPDE
jgi:hypothetical protein